MMMFDVSKPAPTQQQLAEERDQCLASYDQLRKKNWQSLAFAVLLAALALAIFVLVRQDGVSENLKHFFVPSATFAALLLLVVTADMDLGAAILGAIFGGIGAFLFGLLAATVALPAVQNTVGLLIGTFVFLSVALWTCVYISRIDMLRRSLELRTVALDDLLPEKHPDHCIAYLKMVESDEALQSYQFQVNSMGRRPVLGDFWAAQTWIAGRSARLEAAAKRSQAVEACAKFGATAYGDQGVAAH